MQTKGATDALQDDGAHGTCRWVGDRNPLTGCSYLRIKVVRKDGTVVERDYEVDEYSTHIDLYSLDDNFFVQHYRVSRMPGGVLACSCDDAKHHPSRLTQCKHARSLKAIFDKEF